jgi:gliding motility-associated-like protein
VFLFDFYVIDLDTITMDLDAFKDVSIDCEFPQTVILNNVPGVEFLWSNGSQGNSFIINGPGGYSVYAIGPCGIIDFDSIFITPVGEPTINTFNYNLCPDEEISLVPNFYSNNGYAWNTGDTTFSIVVDSIGVYKVIGIENCSQIENVFIIRHDQNCVMLYIPNVFTPNNDGKNDLFIIKGIALGDVFELSIFNRWGQRVFFSNNIEDSWDGTYMNEPVPNGVYVGVLKYSTYRGELKQKGFQLNLLR